MSKKKKNKKVKDCGHGNHFWSTTFKNGEEIIKCIHCKKPGILNLEMN